MRKLSILGFVVAAVLLTGCGGGGTAPVTLTLPAMTVGTSTGLNVSPADGANWTNYTTANGLGNNYVAKVIASAPAIYALTNGTVGVAPAGTTFTNVTTIGSVNDLALGGTTLYAATDLGLQTSVDGGATWTLNPNMTELLYNISASGSMITALGGGKTLRLSLDGGATWTFQQFTVAANNTSAVLAQGSSIYIGTDGSGILVSNDSGATFTNYPTGAGGENDIRTITKSGTTLYIGTSGGLGTSTDSGATWTFRTTLDGLPANGVNTVAVKDSKIYVGTSGGVSVSTDAGATWTTFNTANGLSANGVTSISLP